MFKTFGAGLISLRIASALSAWLTVAVLMIWLRRAIGAAVAIVAGLTLAATFGFIYTHAGRSGNADALFTLLVLLTVVTLWASADRSRLLVLIGPLLAASFLLKGMGMLMPLSIVVAVLAWTPRLARRWTVLAWTGALFLLIVGAWAVARWHVDQWTFFERLFMQDFVAGTFTVLEEHPGTPFYYVALLAKDHYDWLLVGLIALVVRPIRLPEWRALAAFWRDRGGLATVVGSWAALTLLIPSVMRTKLPWYLNPFLPVFALGVGWLVARGLDRTVRARRRIILASAVILILMVAEGRLVWYSFHYRDLRSSVQSVLLDDQTRLSGHTVFRDQWNAADLFVLNAIVKANGGSAASADDFERESHPGDYLLSRTEQRQLDLELVRSGAGYWLYLRRIDGKP